MRYRGRSPRDPQTGFKKSTVQRFDESHLNQHGEVLPPTTPGWIMGYPTLASVLGYSERHLRILVQEGARSLMHLQFAIFYSSDGEALACAPITHVNSAHAARDAFKEHRSNSWRQNGLQLVWLSSKRS